MGKAAETGERGRPQVLELPAACQGFACLDALVADTEGLADRRRARLGGARTGGGLSGIRCGRRRKARLEQPAAGLAARQMREHTASLRGVEGTADEESQVSRVDVGAQREVLIRGA